MAKLTGVKSDGKNFSATGTVAPTEVSRNQSNFSSQVIVLSFNSASSPGVSYTVPGCLTGIDASAGLVKTINIPSTASIPSGQYYLTVQLDGGQLQQILVNVG